MGERRPRPGKGLLGNGIRIALLTSQFNSDVTQAMRREARRAAARLGALVVRDVEVPGAYDVGPVAKALLTRRDVDALVALGAVITGETRHEDLVAENAARILADLAVQTGKPVGLGITGPGQTVRQARRRIDRAAWAVESVVKQFRTLQALRRPDARTR